MDFTFSLYFLSWKAYFSCGFRTTAGFWYLIWWQVGVMGRGWFYLNRHWKHQGLAYHFRSILVCRWSQQHWTWMIQIDISRWCCQSSPYIRRMVRIPWRKICQRLPKCNLGKRGWYLWKLGFGDAWKWSIPNTSVIMIYCVINAALLWQNKEERSVMKNGLITWLWRLPKTLFCM